MHQATFLKSSFNFNLCMQWKKKNKKTKVGFQCIISTVNFPKVVHIRIWIWLGKHVREGVGRHYMQEI